MTVWIILFGDDAPQFVTAYPGEMTWGINYLILSCLIEAFLSTVFATETSVPSCRFTSPMAWKSSS